MPVKDAIESAAVSIRAIRQCGYPLCVFDDYSTEENAKRIDELSQALSFSVVHIADKYAHPSPNYRWVLQTARREAIAQSKHLLIVESDVVVRSETIPMMLRAIGKHVGMVAAITHNQENEINFPYEYARRILRRKGARMTETNVCLFAAPCSLSSCFRHWILSDLTPQRTGMTSPFRIGPPRKASATFSCWTIPCSIPRTAPVHGNN